MSTSTATEVRARGLTRALLLVVLAAVMVLGVVFAQRVAGRVYYRYKTHVEETTVDGRTMSYRDVGSGAPIVVIANGMDAHKDTYLDLTLSLSSVTRVISYDRAGMDASAPSGKPATLDHIVRDMEGLLEKLRAPPPYVLIGHSMGGHIIRYYAATHPGEVAGLVFLDTPPDDWLRYVRQTWTKEEVDEQFVWWRVAEEGGRRLERPDYETNCAMVLGRRIDPGISVLSFTGSSDWFYRKRSPGREIDRRAWADMQGALLDGLPDAKHIVDFSSGHFIHLDNPERVDSEIKRLIGRLRAERR